MKSPLTLFAFLSLAAMAPSFLRADPQPDRPVGEAIAAASNDAYALEVIKPRFPMSMLERGIQGKVVVLVSLSADGDIEGLRVVAASQPEFAEAAVEAIKDWFFEPGRRNGIAIPQTVMIPVSFVIDGKDLRPLQVAAL